MKPTVEILERKAEELSEVLKNDLRNIELDVSTSYTLADAIREGGMVTTDTVGWGDGNSACAMTAAVIAAKARKYI